MQAQPREPGSLLPLPARPRRPRTEKVFSRVYVAAAAVFAGLMIYELYVGTLRIRFEAPWLAGFASMIGIVIMSWNYGRGRVVRAFLRPCAGFVCPRCRYVLSRLPDEGVCPECGTGYTRAAIVTLWEDAYRLRVRFPRTSGVSYTRPDSGAEPPFRAAVTPSASTLAAPPWANTPLRTALAQVEANARSRGYDAPWFPGFRRELDIPIERFGTIFLTDLLEFLDWFDPALWAGFVRQTVVRSNSWEDAINPDVPIQVLRPTDLYMIKLTEAAAAHRSIRRFLDESPALGRSPDWAAVRVVEFARSKAGDPLLYCVNPPNEATGHHRPGCIITFLQNGSDRVLLARSLAEWLARLAACNGVEYAFAPGNLATCPASTREAYLSEFGEMNPGLEITTDTAHDQ